MLAEFAAYYAVWLPETERSGPFTSEGYDPIGLWRSGQRRASFLLASR